MMRKLERLTDDQIEELKDLAATAEKGELMLRALQSLEDHTAAISTALKILQEPKPVDSPEARLTRDLWEVLGGA